MSDLTDQIFAGASAVIAGAALGFSIYEARATRRHNRLSVLPRLDLALRATPAHERFTFSVCNKGLGPAEIVSHDFCVDGQSRKKLREEKQVDTWEKLTAHLNFPHKMNWGFLNPGSLLKPGDEEELVGADYSVYDPALAKAFRQALRRLKIAIKYKSLYGDASELVFVGTEEIAYEP